MSDPVLPPTFQRWMDELLPSPIPRESRATCHDCPMLDASEAGPDAPFHPATKCCTYHPELSNFQVGAILLDDSPEVAPARAVLDRRIDGRLAVSPLAVRPPPAYMTIYNASAGATPTAFGRTPALVCPFYIRDGGLCGIWRHRNSVCASWFCRYERGARGRAFWRLVHLLLKTLEDSLRLWCVAQVDPEVARTAFLFEADSPRGLDEFAVSGVASEPAYLMQWGKWAGMERTFFKKCAQAAAGLSWRDVLAVGGARAAAAADLVRELHERLHMGGPPDRVRRGAAYLVQIGRRPREVRVRNAQLHHDWFDMPADALGVVPRLCGGRLADALDELAREGTPLDPALVKKLIDFEVLVPA